MRLRRVIWIVVCLLCLAGIWLIWRGENRRFTEKKAISGGITSVRSTGTGPNFLAQAALAKKTAKATTTVTKTNPFAYRLSNTSKSLAELLHDRHAILLENALIDSSRPVNLPFPKPLQLEGDPGAYIVQARGPTSPAFQQMLAAAGARVISYIPNNAYLVEAPASIANALAQSPETQSVLPYEPYYKVESSLLSAANSSLPPDAELTLGLFPNDAQQTISQIQSLGAQIVGQDSSPFGPVVRVTAPEDWTALADLAGVQVVEPYHQRVPANDLSRVTLGVSTDTLVSSNYMDLTGSNVVVEVNDTGIDQKHPDFSDNGTAEAPGAAPPPGRVSGQFPIDLVDTNGHGTFVAGEIAGNGSESYPSGGVNVGANAEGSVSNADFRGKAPLAKLFSVNFNRSDSTLQAEAALTNALISNNSWDYGGDNEYDLAAASYDAATRDALPTVTGEQPVLFVFAAGNDGYGQIGGANNSPDTIQSPGTAKDVITVGALEEARNITNYVTVTNSGVVSSNQVWASITANNYQVADFSGCGNVGIGTEGQYGRFKPDVVAPGTFTVSTRSEQWDTNAYYNPTNFDDTLYTNQVVSAGSLNYYELAIPQNAVSVEIQAEPFDTAVTNIPIYISDTEFPTTTTYDYAGTNEILIPSAQIPQSYLNTIQATLLNIAIGDNTSQSFTYNLSMQIAETNDDGNYYQVLAGMNNSLGPWYRYETGTSMAAADVSGVLALIQDFLINRASVTNPSPALMKAMLLNGARLSDAEEYNLQVQNQINYEGWGLVDLPNTLPPTIATNGFTGAKASSIFLQDQSPTNALATGESHTYKLVNQTNNTTLHITLAWTDPPGNPVAAIKLVNSLELVVSNLDSLGTTNQVIYYGNDIGEASAFNTAESPTNVVPVDTINNVQTVIIPEPTGTNYSITVTGYRVNVNAVPEQTNNVAQDYALVVSSGDGDAPGSFTVTDEGTTYNATADQDLTYVDTTNAPLNNQFVGASTPLLGTNEVSLGGNAEWSSNGVMTVGMTNQWHFYVVTNTAEDSAGLTADVTNAAFVTFNADDLSIPRMGVNANSEANSTRPEANIQLFVTTDPTLTNLSLTAISNCVDGAQVGASAGGVFHGAALGLGGEEVIVDTNSQHGEVYYVGVQSEDQMASEYSFIPIFTDIPFSQMNNSNGVETVNGVPVPAQIPEGTPAVPGYQNVLAIALQPMKIQTVVVTNIITQADVGDLVSSLTLDSGSGYLTAVLMNHDSPNTPGTFPLVYDDSGTVVASTLPAGYTLHHSDGPGSLLSFVGQQVGPASLWNFHIANSVTPFSGTVDLLSLQITPHQNPLKGITINLAPGEWYYNYITVPPGYTNLTVAATNLPPTVPPPGLQMYLNYNTEPTLTDYLFEAGLTNGTPPGNSISYGPPLAPGTYWLGITNGSDQTASIYLIATLSGFLAGIPPIATNAPGPAPIAPIAVSSTNIFISWTNPIASVNAGFVATYPRISDLTFTLVSPSGQRVLLMENRGGPWATNAGSILLYSNTLSATATGGAAADTNYLQANPLGGTLPIIYNFYTVPDQMTVYDTTNPADFSTNSPYCIMNTGFASNPSAGPGNENTAPISTNAVYPPGTPGITIIMNQFGNPYATGGGDAWTYTAGSAQTNYDYLMFTEDTNLASLPIKFAQTQYSLNAGAASYTFSDFDLDTNGDYPGLTNIYDPYGGWTVPTNITTYTTYFNIASNQDETITNTELLTNNFVSIVTDPSDSLGDNTGTNFLALADGTITRTLPTIPGNQYTLTFWYRGPGIAGWWRGEGEALDSADPEGNGNNGALIGRFDFPAGEVGQAFEMEYNGQPYDFAGTNSYVQIYPDTSITSSGTNTFVESSALDVGAGGGLTVEGWINPTNTTFQQPLVEWLAATPTNYPNITDTNFSIVAGPFLDRATSHYYYLLGATNWTVSESWAEMLGGHLATVATADEENWIYDAFEYYDGTNRNLWIGLTNNAPGVWVYSSGVTNSSYFNWATNQPDNCGNQEYAAIMTATNAESGLWELADNNGTTCAPPYSNIVYGVAEVDALQPNGVQFWMSVTNQPGTTNNLVSSNGCLYANLVDVTNGAHIIYSAPGLVQSNVFQHVALTYDTNSGIAKLFYDGTNVATTNWDGIHFTPKTTGDVLLGKDMSLLTNNYYGGLMDEMSIYSRALSDAEIAAIYDDSASTTNRLIGKFDPTVTPADGLAEALVNFGGHTNVIYGVNKQWEDDSYTFIATSNSLPITITGLEPGMLLDLFSLAEAPVTNLYYFPEQTLAGLNGDDPYGNWSLQIWDNRINAAVPPDGVLNSWVLQMVLQTNTPPLVTLNAQTPLTITVPPGEIVPLYISVPNWATQAANVMDSDTGPLNVWFNPSQPPTGGGPGDTLLANNVLAPPADPFATLNTLTGPPLEPLLPTSPTNFYYLGVQNDGAHAVTATVEVDFGIPELTNMAPYTGTVATNQSENYFWFDVTNGYEATFQLLKMNGSADLVVSKGPPLPTLYSSAYASFNGSNADQSIYVLTNSMPVPLTNGTWYLGVMKRSSGALNYTVLAKELGTNAAPNMLVIPLTNNVPFTFTNEGPGAALTNFFSFMVTNPVVDGVTNYVMGLRFEVYDMSGNGDLTVQTNLPPFAPPFFQSSQQPGTIPEDILIQTNSGLTNLAALWYLGVPNNETNPIAFKIIAEIETNGVFPAFPGAQGAGAGTAGAMAGSGITNNTVYHVTSLNDDGSYGTLRDAVSSTNRTIVFDLSGVIFLQSPLIITNSDLTIAGQTAPGGGITVAGNMTALQGVHDIIIRDVRFRSGGTALTGFGAIAATNYTSGQTVGFWTVTTNQVSVVTDPSTANGGSNYLALANGVISTNLPTIPGQTYSLSFAYRGPDAVSYWPGDNNAIDPINGNNGTLEGDADYGPGYVGAASFSITGENVPDKVFLADTPSLELTNALTIEAWVYPKAYGGYLEQILLRGDVRNCLDPYYLAVNSSGALQLHIETNDPTACGVNLVAGALPLNTWTHVAGTFDGRTGRMCIYTNGVLLAQTTTTLRPFGALDPTEDPGLAIGNIQQDTTPSDGEWQSFYGYINDVTVYGRFLSDSEVKAIWQDGQAGKRDTNDVNVAQSFAEAQVLVNGQTNAVFYGSNTNWEVKTITFTATGNSTPVAIQGVEPGMLLDALSVDPGGSLQLDTVSNVIADHISAEWSTNCDLSVLDSTNVTVQWSIIADSINNMDTNGYGSVLRYGNGTLSFHHNLYADNAYANPRLGDNIVLDFIDNVIYDWGTNSGFSANDSATNTGGYTNTLNYICNYLIASTNSLTNTIAFWGGTTNTWIYQTNNFIQSTNSETNGLLSGENLGWNMFTTNDTKFDRQFPLPPVTIDEAYQAYERVLDFAGPDMALRDAVDTNIVGSVRTQTGSIVSSVGPVPTPASLLPYLDTDQDGIPDFWDDTFGGSPFVPHPNFLAVDGSGYTELEEYLNWLAGPHALTVTNQPVGVNLQQVFGQTGDLSFFVTNAVNGSVYLTNVLDYTNVSGVIYAITNTSTFSNIFAIFTPANNFGGGTNYGMGSFEAYVTNNATYGYFGPVTVSVVASKVPIAINSDIPPVIITLPPGGLAIDPINTNGQDDYEIPILTNAIGVVFTVTNANGPTYLVAKYGQRATLSDYDYISTNAAGPSIYIGTNSLPVPLTPGNEYVAVVNVSPSNAPVTYTLDYQEYGAVLPPIFTFPTNGDVFTNIETTLFTTNGVASDPNSPPLPLTFALVSGPTNMTVTSGGVISWTPTEAQGDTNWTIRVSVSNGAYSLTNSFGIVVEVSNLPPVFVYTNLPDQLVIVPGGMLDVTDAAVNPNIPDYPLTYTLLGAPSGAGIDTNGVITWTPALAQAGSNYLFTVVATDINPPAINATSLSATNYFYVTVVTGGGGGVPQTNGVAPGAIDWLAFKVPTNAIAATNILVYATNLPVNVWFSTNLPPSITNANDHVIISNATNGVSVLTTTSSPANIVPGSIYFLGVQNPNPTAINFDLVVNFGYPAVIVPTNTIRIASIVYTNIGGKNGFLLTWFAPSNYLFQAQWTAGLAPTSWNTFTNIISYNPAAFTNPANTQFNFFDDGSQSGGLGGMRFYRLVLLQASALTLPYQTNIVAQVSNSVAVTNTATDSDPNAALTYDLVSPPVGASISTNGVITWTNAMPAGLAARFITVVADNELPPDQATNRFTIFVAPFPAITNVTATITNVSLAWRAPTNDQFEVQWTTNLAPPIVWNLLPGITTSSTGIFSYVDTNTPVTMKFYELILLP